MHGHRRQQQRRATPPGHHVESAGQTSPMQHLQYGNKVPLLLFGTFEMLVTAYKTDRSSSHPRLCRSHSAPASTKKPHCSYKSLACRNKELLQPSHKPPPSTYKQQGEGFLSLGEACPA
jgi:hypothetical protein